MRIIGGVYKGRKLKSIASSENTSLRPTSAKVKESIFNILSHKFHLKLHEIKILDLFAGTGSLGFDESIFLITDNPIGSMIAIIVCSPKKEDNSPS